MEDFIIDILLGCPHPDIRMSVVNQLHQLCQAIDSGEILELCDACVIITQCEYVVTSQYHYNHTMSYLHCRFTVTDSTRPLYSETTPVKRQKTSSAESPRHFFLHLLLKHPEGLWDGAESAENSTQWERCMEYFDFLCQLIRYLRGMCVY